MKIWVSGGAGFIGQEVLQVALNRGHQVWGFDSFNETLYSNSVRLIRKKKLSDSGITLSAWNPLADAIPESAFIPDVVINEMAIPGLAPSWTSMGAYMDSNVNALGSLISKLNYLDAKPFIVQASTSSVYGDRPKGADPILDPKSPYGVSKAAAEFLLKAWSKSFGFDYSILRYHSVYGNLQRPDMAFHKFIMAGLEGRPITVNGDGQQVRTNTHVSDVALATLLAAEKQISGLTCDIAGLEPVTLNDSIRAIENAMGQNLLRVEGVPPAGDQLESMGNIQIANEVLSWQPKTTFQDGINQQFKSMVETLNNG